MFLKSCFWQSKNRYIIEYTKSKKTAKQQLERCMINIMKTIRNITPFNKPLITAEAETERITEV